jgi:multiple sugar transport system permease protein
MTAVAEPRGGATVPTTVIETRRPSGPGPSALWRKVLLWTSVLGLSVVFIYPLFWLVSASLKTSAEVFNNEPLPNPVQWSNYATVWTEIPLMRWLLNSVLVGVAAGLTVTVSSAMVAFAFAYFRFPGRNLLFGLVLATMMLPSAATMIPNFLIWDALGFSGTQVPLWAGNLFGSAFYIFLLRQFFLTIPRELFDAARVDGLGYAGIFWRIVLPMSKPALLITFIFELRASWTDLVKPLIFLRDVDLYTLPLGLKTVLDRFGQGGEFEWEIVLAASVVSTVPMVVLFLLTQRHIIDGVATTASR